MIHAASLVAGDELSWGRNLRGIGNRGTVRRRPRKALRFVMEILKIFPLVGMSDDEFARLLMRNGACITMLVKEVSSSQT